METSENIEIELVINGKLLGQLLGVVVVGNVITAAFRVTASVWAKRYLKKMEAAQEVAAE